MPRKQRKLLGRYIVADPAICHGKPTFLGTRIMVAQVLRQLAKEMSWDVIVAQWRGDVSKDAIAEAVALAQRAFEEHAAEYVRRVLRHRRLNTRAKRMGSVIRVSPDGLVLWRIHQEQKEHLAWQ